MRLAHEWNEILCIPKIKLLSGERSRTFVLSRQLEALYLAACPQTMHDIALLILETGLRIGEVLNLEWPDVILQPLTGARFGYLRVRDGKSKNARRTLPLTDRAGTMFRSRQSDSGVFVFTSNTGARYLVTSVNHMHQKARAALNLPKDFVVHSLRHTMLTRLGESRVDAFTRMRIAGHSSITVSQRYVHPSPEAVERAFERLQWTCPGMPELLEATTVSTTVAKAASVSH